MLQSVAANVNRDWSLSSMVGSLANLDLDVMNRTLRV